MRKCLHTKRVCVNAERGTHKYTEILLQKCVNTERLCVNAKDQTQQYLLKTKTIVQKYYKRLFVCVSNTLPKTKDWNIHDNDDDNNNIGTRRVGTPHNSNAR